MCSWLLNPCKPSLQTRPPPFTETHWRNLQQFHPHYSHHPQLLSLARTLSLSHASHCLVHTLTLTPALSLVPSSHIAHKLGPTADCPSPCSLAQSLRRSVTHPLLPPSLAPSLPRSLTLAHSLSHSLSHSITQSLSHSLTHSLTHSLRHSSITHRPTHPPAPAPPVSQRPGSGIKYCWPRRRQRPVQRRPFVERQPTVQARSPAASAVVPPHAAAPQAVCRCCPLRRGAP